MTAPDPTLAAAILGAVARTRVEVDLPAAILAAIRGTGFDLVKRGHWIAFTPDSNTGFVAYGESKPGDLDEG